VTSSDDLVRDILGPFLSPEREKRLNALLEEHPRCRDFIIDSALILRSKLSSVANYEDFLDLFAELVWACLVVKGEGRVQFLSPRPLERTPEYLIDYLGTVFYGECRRIREAQGVSIKPAGPMFSTMSYSPTHFGSEEDNQASRRISDAILDKLGQLRPCKPNVIFLYTRAFGATPLWFFDALKLLGQMDPNFLRARGYEKPEAFNDAAKRLSAVCYREEGIVRRGPRNIVRPLQAAELPLSRRVLDWLEALDFSGPAEIL